MQYQEPYLRVLEHEEEVHVADEDTDELHDAAAGDDELEAEEDPGQVHRLELGAEPEVHDGVLVQLAPDVHDTHHLLRICSSFGFV